MSKKVGPWTIRAEREVYANPWIRVQHHDVLRPDGGEGVYGVVRFSHRATGVVALDAQGRTVLVGQHRFPHDTYTWEIPEGGAHTGEPLLEAIQRELLEETGLRAKKWTPLAEGLFLSDSVTDEKCWLWLAEDLEQGQAMPDETEDLQTRWVDFSEAVEMVVRSEIVDSLSVMGLLLAERHLRFRA